MQTMPVQTNGTVHASQQDVPAEGAHAPISTDVLERLKRISTATLTTQLFKHGLRQQFLVGVRPLNPEAASFAGEAFTLRYIPAREDLDTLESIHGADNLQWAAIEQVPAGHVLVFDSRDDVRAASSGAILLTRLLRRGVAAVVTDGAFRDGPEIARMALPSYAKAMTASSRLSYFHPADVQVPVGCAGVAVYPGDVLVGDAEGVVVIPRHLAVEISLAGEEQELLERYVHSRIDSGEPLAGVYPPSEATRAAYRSWADEQAAGRDEPSHWATSTAGARG